MPDAGIDTGADAGIDQSPALSGTVPALSGLQFNWTAPTSGPPDTYNFYFGATPGSESFLASVAGTVLTYTRTGAVPTTYAAYVTAVTGGVESAPSNEVTQMATETIKPIFASAAVLSNGLGVAVTLLEADSPPILPASPTGFALTVNGATRAITASTVAGVIVTLTVTAVIYAGDVVTVAYVPGNVTDSATTPNAMLTFTAQVAANASGVRNPAAAEIATALRAAQLCLETTPGTLPGAPAWRRLTQSQLIAVPKPAPKPYTPMGMKGISVVQQGTEVSEYALSGVLSYTELLYWLETAVLKSPTPVPVGALAYTRTYTLDSRIAALLPQTYGVQTGSSQGADQAGFVFAKDLSIKTTKDEASIAGALTGWPLADNVALATSTDVKKAPVDPNTIGVYLGDVPASLTRLAGSIESSWMLGGHWMETDYQSDVNPAFDSLVEMVPKFGVKISAAPNAQEQNLLTRLRTGQSIYMGLRARGAIIEGTPGAIVSQYGLDVIMPCKVTGTPGRADKAGVFAHDYDFGAADDPIYGLVKIIVTSDIATL